MEVAIAKANNPDNDGDDDPDLNGTDDEGPPALQLVAGEWAETGSSFLPTAVHSSALSPLLVG